MCTASTPQSPGARARGTPPSRCKNKNNSKKCRIFAASATFRLTQLVSQKHNHELDDTRRRYKGTKQERERKKTKKIVRHRRLPEWLAFEVPTHRTRQGGQVCSHPQGHVFMRAAKTKLVVGGATPTATFRASPAVPLATMPYVAYFVLGRVHMLRHDGVNCPQTAYTRSTHRHHCGYSCTVMNSSLLDHSVVGHKRVDPGNYR